MTRSFDIGKQNYSLYDGEMYKLYQIFKNINEEDNPGYSEVEGALWLDRNNHGALKYFFNGDWQNVFTDKMKFFEDFLKESAPEDPFDGQMWLDKGILKYAKNKVWYPVKAVNTDEGDYNSNYFEPFLYLNPLKATSDVVIDPITGVQKYQYIVPATDYDKFFINGFYNDTYETVSNISIQFPVDTVLNKTTSAVHVNPNNLIGIEKKLIKVDKLNPILDIEDTNTELYAFMSKDLIPSCGRLLSKTYKEVFADPSNKYPTLVLDEANSEYVPSNGKIKLASSVLDKYDFILAVTYKFDVVRRSPGTVEKGKKLLNNKNLVYIDHVTEDFHVFINGFYLDPDGGGNYTYNSTTGYLDINANSKIEVSVMCLGNKETQSITSIDGSNNGVATLTKKYIKPLVIVGPILVSDYTYDNATNKLLIPNARVGMKVTVVESYGGTDTTNTYVCSGVVSEDEKITYKIAAGSYSYCSIDENDNFILFVNGKLVPNEYITRGIASNGDEYISVEDLKIGMKYDLYVDKANIGRTIANEESNACTINTSTMNDCLVYIENMVLCDLKATHVTKLPDVASHNEIKYLVSNEDPEWYMYDKNLGWKMIQAINPEMIDFIANLNNVSQGYISTKKNIHILNNLMGATDQYCSYFAYKYANTIENPMTSGNVTLNTTDVNYNLNYKHYYPMGRNAISEWINGFRQFYIHDLETNKVALPEKIVTKAPEEIQSMFYIIEKPESGQSVTSNREVLTFANKMPETQSVYKTTKPIFPGILKVFINGSRQCSKNYKIINPYTIMFYATLEEKDVILIELRQNYDIKEAVLETSDLIIDPKTFYIEISQNQFHELPTDLFYTNDLITIYVDGCIYGNNYSIDFDYTNNNKKLILKNTGMNKCLVRNPIAELIEIDPDNRSKWLQMKNHPYDSNETKSKHTLIFEWR